jgi:hypothetical protein
MSCPAFAWAMEQGRRWNIPTPFRFVLVAIAERANGARVCWPTYECLMKDTGLSERTCHAATKWLSSAEGERPALLRIDRAHRKANTYHLIMAPEPAKEPPKGGSGRLFDDEAMAQQARPSTAQPPHPKQAKTADFAPSSPQMAQNKPACGASQPYKLTLQANQEDSANAESHAREARLISRSHEPDGFPEFYREYPRKDPGRKPAAVAYAKALKRGATPPQILDGLRKYPFPPERGFQPHITTWLNQDRWTIEEQPDDDANPMRPQNFRNGFAALHWDDMIEEARRTGHAPAYAQIEGGC